jgi:porin
VAGLLLLAQGASAAPPDDWREREQLTGDWGGLRTRLEEHGIEPWAEYTTGFWANLDGGFDTGVRYEGFAGWGVDIDLGALADSATWADTSFHVDWISYHGGQPSEDLVGTFPINFVSGWEAEDSVRFYQIYLEQEFFDGALLIDAGQLVADEKFFISHIGKNFLSASFGNFIGVGPVYSLAAPGLYVRFRPSDAWVVRAGAYTADPGDDESSNFGFDWKISSNAGAALYGEVETQRSPLGLPGTYTVGAFGGTNEFTDFGSGGTADGAYELHAVIDQTLLLNANGQPRLAGFVRAAFAPQDDRVAARYHVDGGLVLYGPLPGRESDVLGVACSFVDFADDYVRSQRAAGQRVSRNGAILELTDRAQVTGWLTVQPDLQLLLDPHFSRSDAVVLGLNAVITF